ncbi:metastasis-associated protein MTA3-like isoform X3 [Apostichopus japonicus]|uniref:metastasis-associated protein MTA3-like isoform X3 n=1 Tax=Stichopus japonicus TaxID=307972 RepID=UPI003AB5163D
MQSDKAASQSMAANMYRVGDYVFFETSSSQPYLIRRIEELNKTQNGNVEAKVVCFYRRRDIPSSLIQLADKHAMTLEEEQEEALEELSEKQRHQLKHRELFLSRQLETLPATHIRGKCTVTLLNETESLLSYLSKEDAYFYSLVYDPHQKTLLADKGEIRVGPRYQAEIPDKFEEPEKMDERDPSRLEIKIWTPENPLSGKEIDQFLVLTRSVGTFGRALDCSSSIRQPSLHMSAAAASRDITLFHSMDVLYQKNYEIGKAVATLVPAGGPVICRDQLEEWSSSEANLFEEALEKYGKDFNDIRQDFLPWKSLKSVIEYYYMWKTTDRYVQQKRLKAAEADSKLKQVYIPNYNKPNPNQIGRMGLGGQVSMPGTRACESCHANSSYQWYSWGPANMQCRLCASCWIYWKKCGGLKMPTRLGEIFLDGERQGTLRNRPDRPGLVPRIHPLMCTVIGCGKEFKLKAQLARHCQVAHGLSLRTAGIRGIGMKTRIAFALKTTPMTKLSRILCKDMLKLRHISRCPFDAVDVMAVKQECQAKLPSVGKATPKLKEKKWPKVDMLVGRLETFREKTRKEGVKKPAPKPSLGGPTISSVSHVMMRKTNYETGQDTEQTYPSSNSRHCSSPMKRVQMGGRFGKRDASHLDANGDASKKKMKLSWMDAPDDVFFHADGNTRNIRKTLSIATQKRLARHPWRETQIQRKPVLEKAPPLPPPPPPPAPTKAEETGGEPIVID